MKKGSALVLAIWTIAVLSIMVLSFATEARMQTSINVYVRERNRVKRLVDAGQILGEIVLLGFKDVKEWSEDEDANDLDEEDRWYKEKRDLKTMSCCKIGPILLDEENPDSGVVTIDIELANSGAQNGININNLYEGGDKNYLLRWQMILSAHGVDEELEVEDEEGRKVNFMNLLIASWNDWRDDNDNETQIEGVTLGAEAKWYEEQDEENDVKEEDRRRPRNGSIPDVKELASIRGFRDYPSILTGGLLYPDQEESVENPRLTGIEPMFGTTGSSKLFITPQTTREQLLSIPGIFCEDDDEEMTESGENAHAIIAALKIKPTDYDVQEDREWWPYKDWQDLQSRVSKEFNVEIQQEASEYIEFQPNESSIFKMTITGESMGIVHSVKCECYIKDNKVRYISWQED